MANDWFKFKRFTVQQANTAMKVGTDGVLLGAWAMIDEGCRRVLDVGCGTGLIALMAAQRTEQSGAAIVGVEIDEAAAIQAAENAERSPWGERIEIVTADVAEFAMREENVRRFDAVISNPPYFVDSLTAPELNRTVARHAVTLTFDGLLSAVDRVMTERGCFSAVLPFDARNDFVGRALDGGLCLERELAVCSKSGAKPKRVLLAFRRAGAWSDYRREDLTLHSDGEPTEEYRRLTGEFYVGF